MKKVDPSNKDIEIVYRLVDVEGELKAYMESNICEAGDCGAELVAIEKAFEAYMESFDNCQEGHSGRLEIKVDSCELKA